MPHAPKKAPFKGKSKNPVKTMGRVFKIILTKHGFLFSIAVLCILVAAAGAIYPSLMLNQFIDAIGKSTGDRYRLKEVIKRRER